MKITSIISSSIIVFFIFLLTLTHDSQAKNDNFLQCLSEISQVVYTPNNSSFLPLLKSKIGNLRFDASFWPRPALIVTPLKESHIQKIVICARRTGMLIRTRSGGHEFQGLSYTAQKPFIDVPFVVMDLRNLTKITIDTKEKTAWVQTGSTQGELYYRISQASKTLAFPGGIWPSVGTGGFFSGGGYGILIRKFGFASDNVIDARIVDPRGRILNRTSMGEDLFWAIRGGGGNTFGIVIAWKLGLVTLPEKITVFTTKKTLEQNLTQIMNKWQEVAPKLPQELTIFPVANRVNSTVEATFDSHFLGPADTLVEVLGEKFPELGIKREDCSEVSWIQMVLFFAGVPIDTDPEALIGSDFRTDFSFIIKIDYVQELMPVHAFEGLWKLLLGNETGQFSFPPYGGKMDEIPEDNIPYPHRAGNLYAILQMVSWDPSENNATERFVDWSRNVYKYMTPFVSKSPRGAFVNYRDLDLGVNQEGNTSYEQAKVWGVKYFNKNFDRLVKIKTKVDPENFLRYEQSVPPFFGGMNKEVEDI